MQRRSQQGAAVVVAGEGLQGAHRPCQAQDVALQWVGMGLLQSCGLVTNSSNLIYSARADSDTLDAFFANSLPGGQGTARVFFFPQKSHSRGWGEAHAAGAAEATRCWQLLWQDGGADQGCSAAAGPPPLPPHRKGSSACLSSGRGFAYGLHADMAGKGNEPR